MADKKERIFRSSDLPVKSFQFFDDMKKMKEYCDVTFRVGNQIIAAHRLIITAVIPFFRGLLSSNIAHLKATSIDMPGIEPSAFLSLIEFAYKCEVKIDSQNVTNLLSAACFLGVDEVRDECCNFVVSNLENEDALSVRELACELNCLELVKDIDRYVRENFEAISQTKQFLKCPLVYLKELLKEDSLNVSSEKVVFEAIIRWVKDSPDGRTAVLPELLRKVRMTLLKPGYLAQILETEDLFRASIQCRNLLEATAGRKERVTKAFSFSSHPRQFIKIGDETPSKSKERIYTLHAQLKCILQQFDCMDKKWFTKGSRGFFVNGGSTVQHQNMIYFFHWGHTLQYDPKNGVYRYLKHVPTPRVLTGATSLKNAIYICGGRVGQYVSNVVESFDPEKNEWSTVSSMHTCRWAPSVVALGEYVYVMGGIDGLDIHDCVERYDSVAYKWRNMSPMLTKRYLAGAATLNGKIYVCGGDTVPTETKCVAFAEVYDPVVNNWKFISPMKTARYWFSLLPCSRKLYAIGGYNKHGGHTRSMEVYDPERDEWTSGPLTDANYDISGAVVVSTSYV